MDKQLKPISASLDRLQADHALLADVVREFIILETDDNLKPHKKLILQRKLNCVTPAHFCAYILHPKYMGENLKAEEEELARQWIINEIDENFLILIINFKAQVDPFPKSYFLESVRTSVKPHVWWSSLTAVDKKFTTFASHLQTCVASSAGIERIFSNFSFVQTKLRNRLGLETASKLVTCYKMLNFKTKQDDDRYRMYFLYCIFIQFLYFTSQCCLSLFHILYLVIIFIFCDYL